MPRMSIYLKESDVELFKAAALLSGNSISQTIAQALREFVRHSEVDVAYRKHFENFNKTL